MTKQDHDSCNNTVGSSQLNDVEGSNVESPLIIPNLLTLQACCSWFSSALAWLQLWDSQGQLGQSHRNSRHGGRTHQLSASKSFPPTQTNAHNIKIKTMKQILSRSTLLLTAASLVAVATGDEYTHQYKKGDRVDLWVNKVRHYFHGRR